MGFVLRLKEAQQHRWPTAEPEGNAASLIEPLSCGQDCLPSMFEAPSAMQKSKQPTSQPIKPTANPLQFSRMMENHA